MRRNIQLQEKERSHLDMFVWRGEGLVKNNHGEVVVVFRSLSPFCLSLIVLHYHSYYFSAYHSLTGHNISSAVYFLSLYIWHDSRGPGWCVFCSLLYPQARNGVRHVVEPGGSRGMFCVDRSQCTMSAQCGSLALQRAKSPHGLCKEGLRSVSWMKMLSWRTGSSVSNSLQSFSSVSETPLFSLRRKNLTS